MARKRYLYDPSFNPNVKTEWVKNHADWLEWDNVFSDEELELIKTITNNNSAAGYDESTTGDGTTVKVHAVPIPINEESKFIYDKIAHVVKTVNEQYYHYNLVWYADHLIVNYSQAGHYYDWHVDRYNWAEWDQNSVDNLNHAPLLTKPTRKITVVLQLSDPSEYEGGDLEIMLDGGVQTAKKKKGLMNILPGFVVHRVTPITGGLRLALIGNGKGRNFI